MNEKQRTANRCKKINDLAEKARDDGKRTRYLNLRRLLFNEQARLREMGEDA